MNALYWSIRRELWENRSIFLAPLTASGIVLFGFFARLGSLMGNVRAAQAFREEGFRAAIELPYVVAAIIIMATQIILAIFYSLDALYGERRDRSVLFWKSMPVSDQTAVLAKASIPILVLPLVCWAATVATQGVMMLVSSVALPAIGVSASVLWNDMSFSAVSGMNFGHLVAFHGIWYAPLYAWLLLVSAWATRVPFLWAVLPPAAIGVIERLVLNTSYFSTMLQTYFFGTSDPIKPSAHLSGGMTMDMMNTPLGDLVMRPSLWVGLIVAAFLLFGAIRLRRSQGAM